MRVCIITLQSVMLLLLLLLCSRRRVHFPGQVYSRCAYTYICRGGIRAVGVCVRVRTKRHFSGVVYYILVCTYTSYSTTRSPEGGTGTRLRRGRRRWSLATAAAAATAHVRIMRVYEENGSKNIVKI